MNNTNDDLNMKIALFDFCETLVNFQTADRYIEYVVQNKKKNVNDIFLNGIICVFGSNYIRKLFYKLFHFNIKKCLLLLRIKGMDKQELTNIAHKYYIDVIKPNLIMNMIDKLLEYKRNGYRIAIVSAGYDIYLKYFVNDFNINDLLANKLLFDENNIFTGKCVQPNCYGENKVLYLKKYYGVSSMNNIESVAFSDSPSDIPFLKFAKDSIVVAKESVYPNWAKKNNFKVFNWKE